MKDEKGVWNRWRVHVINKWRKIYVRYASYVSFLKCYVVSY